MWDAFKDLIFWLMQICYDWVGDWGMAIMIITLVFRVCLIPLMQKQIKSSFHMQRLQPMMQEIQSKYADDPMRLNQEMQKIYKESNFNPLSGCLPLLLQMPIFVAMFQVLQEMSWRASGQAYNFYQLVPNLTLSPSATFSEGFLVFLPYLILLLVFALATFIPTILMQRGQTGTQHTQMLIMCVIMTGVMLFIGWGSPAGVLMFWGTSSLFGIFQQQIVTRLMKQKEEAKEAERRLYEPEPQKIEVVRKAKKKRPTKKH